MQTLIFFFVYMPAIMLAGWVAFYILVLVLAILATVAESIKKRLTEAWRGRVADVNNTDTALARAATRPGHHIYNTRARAATVRCSA